MDKELASLAMRVGECLCRRNLMLATAESCTGGWLSEALTSVPGSSAWFERGFVTYSNRAKHEMLEVDSHTLSEYGAISLQTVREMAEGALSNSDAQLSVAISGLAGPGGGQQGKPVGMVCLAWAAIGQRTHCKTEHFSGDREQVRRQSVIAALQGLIDVVDEWY